MDEAPAGQRKTRVFIIDDDDVFTDILRHRLESEGMQVRRAPSGDEALVMLPQMLTSGERPDAILLDISMPGLNGIDVLERLHADHSLSSIPVALLSNFSREQDVAWAQKIGATKTIDKTTVLPADVPDIVRELLRT